MDLLSHALEMPTLVKNVLGFFVVLRKKPNLTETNIFFDDEVSHSEKSGYGSKTCYGCLAVQWVAI